MRRIKLKKSVGDYKAGTVFTVLGDGYILERDGTAWDADGKQVRNAVDPQRAEAWSDAGYVAKKKEAKS
jgi:hypothetical protein